MFSLIKGLWNQAFQKPTFKVLLIGLDGSGKTTLLNGYKKISNQQYSFEKISPTVGLNMGNIEMAQSVIQFWDLGGQKNLRKLWGKYLSDCDAIIYCIDCTIQLDESVDYLVKSLQSRSNQVPVLVMLNKQDQLEQQEQQIDIMKNFKVLLQKHQFDQDIQIEFCSAIEQINLIDPLLKLNE